MNRSADHRKVNRLTLSALLTAAMLVLGYAESLLPPFGIPGIKPGLSNSVLIFAVYMLDIPTAYLMMTIKVVLSGLLFGGVTAIIYAFAGGLASLTVMCLLSRAGKIRPIFVSAAGGITHNAAQIGAAALILHTPVQMLYYLAILAATGLGCGLLTGTIASSVMKHIKTTFLYGAGENRKQNGRFAVIAAAVTVAAAAVLCIVILRGQTPVSVARPENGNGIRMISPDELPGVVHTP